MSVGREYGHFGGTPRPRGSQNAVIGTVEYLALHEDSVARLVNTARAEAGLPPLRQDDRLRAAARAHSKDMAVRDFCAHVTPDGVTPLDRMLAAGCPTPGGENVATGQENAHVVMQAWMDSPGHRANVLSPFFAIIGVGAYFGRGGPCWTQNFGY